MWYFIALLFKDKKLKWSYNIQLLLTFHASQKKKKKKKKQQNKIKL